MFAWHFLQQDMCAGSGMEPAWTVGEERTWAGDVVLCQSGYHSSPTALDALQYARGPVLCLVDVSEPVTVNTGQNPGHKQVGAWRRLVACADVTHELRLFACDCAERALFREREHRREPDKRSWNAIVVARRFANGDATEAELAAAWAAARDAARDAAGAAARAAARDAAWAAARDAARDAAWAAARAAAWAAARDAETEWQRRHLAELVAPLFPQQAVN